MLKVLTGLGPLRYRAVEGCVCELGPVVVLVNDVNDDVNGVLHLVAVQVHGVSSQLWNNTQTHKCSVKSQLGPTKLSREENKDK